MQGSIDDIKLNDEQTVIIIAVVVLVEEEPAIFEAAALCCLLLLLLLLWRCLLKDDVFNIRRLQFVCEEASSSITTIFTTSSCVHSSVSLLT